MMSELVLAYLDDIALGDEAEVCLYDFLRLDEGARRVGLEINHNKCELLATPSNPEHYLRLTISCCLSPVFLKSSCWARHCLRDNMSTQFLKRSCTSYSC
jgi:hypothetical protein